MKNALWAVRAGLDDLAEAIELRDWDAVVVRMHGVCTRFESAELIEALTPVAPASIARAWVVPMNPIAAVRNIPEAVTAALAADGRSKELVLVFSGPPMTAAHEDLDRDEDTAKRLKRTYKRLRASGEQRPLREPVDDWRARVVQLEADFPNFASVINGALKSHLAMRDLGSRTRLPPLLLLGPPGVGKTHFASQLATILQAPMQTVSFAAATNGSALSGSSVFWSNSSPGRLAECLAWGPAGQAPAANPLILLDEIDKAGSDLRYDPLGALYGLLEISTAASFEDEALPDLRICTQYVSWVATANSIDGIPEPTRSRLIVFEIPAPTLKQARAIAMSIFATVVQGIGLDFSLDLPDSVLDSLASLSPRTIKTRLSVCIGLAVFAGRRYVLHEDWLHTQPQSLARSRIGFAA